MWNRAWTDTWSTIGINNWRNALRSILFVGITLLVVRYIGGQAQMSEEFNWIASSGIAVGVIFVGTFLFNLIRAPVYIKWEREKIPIMTVSPYCGKKQADWDYTEHYMWAELRVQNASPLQELQGAEVTITNCLAVVEKHDDPNELILYDQYKWNPSSIYWSERNAPPSTYSLSIPPSNTKVALVGFQDNSNGGNFLFNTQLRNWVTGGVKIDVEISSRNSALLKKSYYIECRPNYVGETPSDYDPSRFEFEEWDNWVGNRNVTLLEIGK